MLLATVYDLQKAVASAASRPGVIWFALFSLLLLRFFFHETRGQVTSPREDRDLRRGRWARHVYDHGISMHIVRCPGIGTISSLPRVPPVPRDCYLPQLPQIISKQTSTRTRGRAGVRTLIATAQQRHRT